MSTPGAKKIREDNPDIFEAYELYTLCRSQVPYHHEYVKAGKTYATIIPFTTGLSFLPYPGSVMEQPEYLISLFDSFMDGDAHGFSERVNKK